MHRPSRNARRCLGMGLGLATLLLATAAMAQEAAGSRDDQSQSVESVLDGLCADAPCAPPALAGRYRIMEGPFTGSELRLDAGGGYSLNLGKEAMRRRFDGRWQLDDGMVLLQHDPEPGKRIQLLSDEEVSAAGRDMRALLADMERDAASPGERAELLALRAELEGRHLPGTPVHVVLSDPMSGVAAEGVRVALELEGGVVLDGEELSGGNDYRFMLPDAVSSVSGMVLRFPGVEAPIRFPLSGPVRPRYAVLFDACDLGACQAGTMGVVPNRLEGEWVMEAMGVGVFVRSGVGSVE